MPAGHGGLRGLRQAARDDGRVQVPRPEQAECVVELCRVVVWVYRRDGCMNRPTDWLPRQTDRLVELTHPRPTLFPHTATHTPPCSERVPARVHLRCGVRGLEAEARRPAGEGGEGD